VGAACRVATSFMTPSVALLSEVYVDRPSRIAGSVFSAWRLTVGSSKLVSLFQNTIMVPLDLQCCNYILLLHYLQISEQRKL